MNNTSDNNILNNNQEDEIDLKKIIYLLLRQWHWFLLFGALGLGGAYLYTQVTKSKYSVSTTVLVPEKSTGLDMKSMFEGALEMPKNNIINQIEIIKSYQNISKTLSNLNWRTSWSKRNLMVWNGIYLDEPYDVKEKPGFFNPTGIPVYITPGPYNTYTISVDGETKINKVLTKIKFEDHASFDAPFSNKYFNFTLLKKVNELEAPDGEYSFVFNNLNEASKAYQKKINAELKDKDGDIIEVSIEGEQPEKESVFLNELIHVYISGKLDLQNEAQRRSLEFIDTQLSGISDSLASAGDKFTEFRSKNKIMNIGEEGTLVMNNLKDIESERAKSQMQLDYFHNVLSYLNKSGNIKELVSPSVVGIEDASLNALVLNLGELYNRRQVIAFSAKENNPTLVLIDKEITQNKNRLTENLRNLTENATKSINSLKDRQANISFQLNKLPKKEQQMITIQRQFDLTNEVYTFLLQKRAEINIALASSIPDVQIIDSAIPENAIPIGLTQKIIFIFGIFIGLAFPLALILLKNFFDDRIHTQEDVENHTTIPILGNIMHGLTKSDLIVYENPNSSIAESFRVLRTNMEFMLQGHQGNVISIHSTNPGEGKSFTSVNLASILAMNDEKVLLIGADMRKPRLHHVFDLPNEKGLSTHLIGYDELDQVIHSTQIENLSVMTSGPIPPNPAEILSKPTMKKMIDQLRLQYNYIIFDNAPVAIVTDGSIVSRFSDINIFILRYGISHKHQLEIINQFAAKKTIGNPALIVNDIKTNSFGYTYYKYYQYEAYQNTYYSVTDSKSKKAHKSKKKIKGDSSRKAV